jgi:DNA-binding NarL/FixJ family response regulator
LIRDFRTGELLVIPTRRNCSRCGQDFGAVGREYVCPACRKTKHSERVPSRKLSFRERQVVQLVEQAKANKEIAFELSLTEGTVKEYLYHIFRKLGVRNRTDLALWGRANLAERKIGIG